MARITSVTVPSASLVISWAIRRSSGPTPAIGLMAPPSTWYLPRNSRVRSTATTSFGSSTTQMVASERRGSRQTRQFSSWATLPQMLQNLTRAFTSRSTSASRLTSSGSSASRWKAIRWALLGPIPGSRPSSSIRSWTAPSYTPSAYGVPPTTAPDAALTPPPATGSVVLGELVDHGAAEHLGDERGADQARVVKVDVVRRGVELRRFGRGRARTSTGAQRALDPVQPRTQPDSAVVGGGQQQAGDQQLQVQPGRRRTGHLCLL